MTSFSRRIADWASTASLPRDDGFLEIARLSFVDTFACMIAGSRSEAVSAALGAAATVCKGDVPVFGTESTAPLDWAALANGAAAHALDFDDNFEPALGHASAVLVPAILSAGYQLQSPGQDLLDAYVVGLEVMGRLGLIMNMRHYAEGWHSTLTLGTPAVAAAIARLGRLDMERTAHALSIAASLSGGSNIQFGTTTKHMHCGFAARAGIAAALLAQFGLQGAPEAIAGPWGLVGLMAGRQQEDALATIGDLGVTFMPSKYGLMRKLYPCCGAMHRAIDASIRLAQKNRVELESIGAVTVSLAAIQTQNLRFPEPTTPSEARFSLQYCIAYALLHGALPPKAFDENELRNPTVRKLMAKVSMIEDPDLHGDLPADAVTPSTVRIRLADATELIETVVYQQGHGRNPLTAEQVNAKFVSLVEPALGEPECMRILAHLETLPKLRSISCLT